MVPPAGEVTRLLNAWREGDRQALDQLAPIVDVRRAFRGIHLHPDWRIEPGLGGGFSGAH